MELRQDPITRSWVVIGPSGDAAPSPDPCPLCPGTPGAQTLLSLPVGADPWGVRVCPHLAPLYQIEGDLGRAAEGIYDRMRAVGAHEIIIETPDHNRPLSRLTDDEIELVLSAYSLRIVDLKRDARFKYVTVFKNQGEQAGADWSHAYSQVTATTFVPRRILYELRACRTYYQQKERCVFCDIVRQEEKQGKRVIDTQGDYVAFCPYASRVPFETWIMSRKHNHQFEAPRTGAKRRNLATLLGRLLRRFEKISESYHMVLHTCPNTRERRGELQEYWKTIAEDYHWHMEVMPILPAGRRSYALKEVYFNQMFPEQAAERLRALDPNP